MEQFEASNYAPITDGRGHGLSSYQWAKDQKTFAISRTCKCQRKFYQLWKPVTFDCAQCNEIADLKQKNDELIVKLEDQAIEKDAIIAELEKKLTEFETKQNENVDKLTEKISELKTTHKQETDEYSPKQEVMNNRISLKELEQKFASSLKELEQKFASNEEDSHSEDSNYSLVEEQQEQ